MGSPQMALMWIVIGAVFDFFDGMSARLLHVSSPIGKELDSLADDITFGVAPSAILFYELMIIDYPSLLEPVGDFIPYSAFIMAAFSALRLAKFNLDERQTLGFIGMPTPANALFWGSLICGYHTWFEQSNMSVFVLLALMLFCSWLLVCEIPMFALKFKHWGISEPGNIVKYGFIAFSAAVLAIGQVAGIAIVIVAYVLLSILLDITAKKS